ncbi:MAG: hypothetical protein ACKO6I_08035 [Sphingomonadales bacterium]
MNRKDTSKYNLSGEILFSKSRNTAGNTYHFGGSDESKTRTECLFVIANEFNRSNKTVAPWFSPVVAVGTGYFISETSNYISSNWSGNINANGNIVTYSVKDTMGFKSIPLMPQLGFNIRPFNKSARFGNLAISFRAGYQFNIVLNHFASSTRLEDEWIEKSFQDYYKIHTNTTTYKSFSEGNFPKTYIQCGLSNLFNNKNNSRMGYRFTYSRNGNVQSGIEVSITCKLR